MDMHEEKSMVAAESDQHENVAGPTPKAGTEVTHDLGDLDLANSKAYKGDDSDGKVVWTPRTVLAFLSLAGLNSGIYLTTTAV